MKTPTTKHEKAAPALVLLALLSTACAEKAPPPRFPEAPPPVLAAPIGAPAVVEVYGVGAATSEEPPPAVSELGPHAPASESATSHAVEPALEGPDAAAAEVPKDSVRAGRTPRESARRGNPKRR
jgi:hypothetical protein